MNGPRPPCLRAGRFARAFGVAVVLLTAACAPSLSSLQPAHVAPAGHLQATAGMEGGIPTGTVSAVIDTARTLSTSAKNRALTDAEIGKLFDAGVSLATSPPSIGQHFALAYSVVDRTELQLRYAAGGWRLGARHQVLRHQEGPFDLVIGFGVSRSTTSIPFADYVPYVKANDFTRWTYDLPVVMGTSGTWYRVWAGPRLAYSRFGSEVTVALPNNPVEQARLQGSVFYLGGQVGAALGYEYFFLGLELTAVGLTGSATSSSTTRTRTSDVGGFLFYPALALMGDF